MGTVWVGVACHCHTPCFMVFGDAVGQPCPSSGKFASGQCSSGKRRETLFAIILWHVPGYPLLLRARTAKARMVRSGLRIALSARAGHVTLTILIGAKKRTAFLYALGDSQFLWIKAIFGTLRI